MHSPTERKVVGSIPGSVTLRLKASTQCHSGNRTACTSWTEKGKAMCSKPPVSLTVSKGPCGPSDGNQFTDLDPEPLEMEYRGTDLT